MPIRSGDIRFLDESLEALPEGKHNLFGPLSGIDNAERTVEYRLVLVHNFHANLTLMDATVSMHREEGVTDVAISVDPTPSSVIDADRKVCVEDPSVLEFSDSGRVGSLPPKSVRGVWVRRQGTDSAPRNDDGFTLRVAGDTMEI